MASARESMASKSKWLVGCKKVTGHKVQMLAPVWPQRHKKGAFHKASKHSNYIMKRAYLTSVQQLFPVLCGIQIRHTGIRTSSSRSMLGLLRHMVAKTMRDFCPSDSCLMGLVCIFPLTPKRPKKARHWSTSFTKPAAGSLGYVVCKKKQQKNQKVFREVVHLHGSQMLTSF